MTHSSFRSRPLPEVFLGSDPDSASIDAMNSNLAIHLNVALDVLKLAGASSGDARQKCVVSVSPVHSEHSAQTLRVTAHSPSFSRSSKLLLLLSPSVRSPAMTTSSVSSDTDTRVHRRRLSAPLAPSTSVSLKSNTPATVPPATHLGKGRRGITLSSDDPSSSAMLYATLPSVDDAPRLWAEGLSNGEGERG